METKNLLLKIAAGDYVLIMAFISLLALAGLIGAGIAIIFSLRKKIISKEKRIAEIISKKTEKLILENGRLKKDIALFEMLSSVALHTESAVFVANENGEIEWVNQGFTNITGYSLEKFKKNRGSTIMEASCHPDIIQIINKALQYKKSIAYETHTFTKNCRKIFLSSLLTPIFDEHGELKRFVIIDTDISKYIALKEDHSKVTHELFQKNQAMIFKIAQA